MSRAPETLEPANMWQVKGACTAPEYTGIRDVLWFAEDSERDATREAITICGTCPVRIACLAAANAEEAGKGRQNRFGIRGGQTARQRWNAEHKITPREPREPNPIITYGSHQQAYDACVLGVDDHLIWVGGNEIRVGKTRYSPNQTAWWVAHGTAPVGRVFTDCNQGNCVLHLTDQTVRDARKAAPVERPVPEPPECGSRSAYRAHLARGENCDKCKAANADADRRLRNTGTTRVKASA